MNKCCCTQGLAAESQLMGIVHRSTENNNMNHIQVGKKQQHTGLDSMKHLECKEELFCLGHRGFIRFKLKNGHFLTTIEVKRT